MRSDNFNKVDPNNPNQQINYNHGLGVDSLADSFCYIRGISGYQYLKHEHSDYPNNQNPSVANTQRLDWCRFNGLINHANSEYTNPALINNGQQTAIQLIARQVLNGDTIEEKAYCAVRNNYDDITCANGDGENTGHYANSGICLLYTSPSPRDGLLSRMPSSA